MTGAKNSKSGTVYDCHGRQGRATREFRNGSQEQVSELCARMRGSGGNDKSSLLACLLLSV